MSRLDDGFSTIVGFADNPTVLFYEKTLTPPGMAGGGANDTTTMRNLTLRTMAPKKLKSLTEMSVTAAYDTAVFDTGEVWAMINSNQLITITWPDTATLDFWGWLDEFQPGEVSEGSQPTAELKIIPSNQDDNGDETAPVYTGP